MADNVSISTATGGPTVATKDRSSVHFQQMIAEIATGQVTDAAGVALTVKVAKLRSSTTNAEIVAQVTSKKIRVLAFWQQASGSVNVNFRDATPTDLTPIIEYNAREGITMTAPAGGFLFETASQKALQITLSAAVTVSTHVVYVEV